MNYIIKDWYAAELVKHFSEPTLTGIASNEERRKRYWRMMEDYAIFLCGRTLFRDSADELRKLVER